MLELVAADLDPVVVEDHAAGAGGALVYRGDEVCHGAPCESARFGLCWESATVHDGQMGKRVANLADMPRGGPGASCLDRLLQTDRLEYLDRDDVDDTVKRGVVRTLDRAGELFGEHDRNARLILDEVAGVADPAILELGAGHGAVSRRILREHPTARVTASDIDADAVARMAAGELCNEPRATVRTLDATEI